MSQDSKRTEVQEIIWNIMKDLKPILEDCQFPYFMLGGTLLGAIRHKGFIPWDDDIDIGIPREEYEEFVNDIQEMLPEHLKLQTYWDESPHHYYFSRIVDTRYELERKGSLKERNENVWIDIFPLDGMPNNSLVRRIHMYRLLYARFRYHIATFDKVNLHRPNRPFYERVAIFLIRISGIGNHSDARKWLDKIDALLVKYPPEESDWIVNFMGQYIFKEMFPKKWYGEGTAYPFEDSTMIGPDQYDRVLTQQYGAYMTPPDDQDKNAHDAVLVENQKD